MRNLRSAGRRGILNGLRRGGSVPLGLALGLVSLGLTGLGCGPKKEPTAPAATSPAPVTLAPTANETHLGPLRQLTFSGENAEAYWSFDGKQLIYQAHDGPGCDQIYRMPATGDGKAALVSTGEGTTTCSYFLPGDQDVIYASTHLAGPECPPKPGHEKGYVWPLYPSFDIFRAKPDGSAVTRLTTTDGYDAEGTVCGVDGSILFTSVRDGDLELYRMNADGTDQRRITNAVGYDGGGFFNRDCTKIVWRASRPKGAALTEYQTLLREHLVKPGKLEIYVANADGSDARQITYFDAASFAPYWHPSGNRILFSSNYGDPKGREFDLWAVDANGTRLERITHTPGFDGFPMFSPDGTSLAFSSNRANAPGSHDTNVFVAPWKESPADGAAESPADRVHRDIAWLADPEMEGRGVGTKGIVAAGELIENQFKEIGLVPVGNGYRHEIQVTVGVKVAAGTGLSLDGKALPPDAFQPIGFSASGQVAAGLVLAGYGVVSKEHGIDDYAGVNVKGRIVVVRRFAPDAEGIRGTEKERTLGDLRMKAWQAREKGAKALIVVDSPAVPTTLPKDYNPPPEAAFPGLLRSEYGDAGLPIVFVHRAAFAATLKKLEQKQWVNANLKVALDLEKQPAFNVLGKLPSKNAGAVGTIVIGAHYDHLGFGGRHSLSPEEHVPHLGADDNASGVATMLEIARQLRAQGGASRDIVFMAFTAEELGLLGSSELVHSPPPGFVLQDVVAMLNLDMVGRLRDNQLTVLGATTADEWPAFIDRACTGARIECASGGGGIGPSDQSSFFAAGIPVLHFFTGSHADYHKPSDSIAIINAAGAGQVASLVTSLTTELAAKPGKLTFRNVEPSGARGDTRSFNASLGSMPDYAGPKDGVGVLLAGVRPGGAAELAGMQRGDVLVRLGQRDIKSVHDLMYALNAFKPNETVTAVVRRDGKEVSLKVTFQESTGRR